MHAFILSYLDPDPNMFKRLLTGLCALTLHLGVQAQNVEFQSRNFPGRTTEFNTAVKAFQKGKKLLSKEEPLYAGAKLQFEEAYAFNPNNAELCFYFGVCLAELGEPVRAIDLLQAAKRLDPEVARMLDFYLGKAYQLNMQWDSALVYYTRYERALARSYTDELALVTKKKKECANGKTLSLLPYRFKADNIGVAVNSPYEDYTPFVSPDESVLLFTSRRPKSPDERSQGKAEALNEDIFISYKANGQWSAAVNAGPMINTDSHDAICGLYDSGRVVLIFKGDVKGGDLFYVRYERGQWGRLCDFGPSVNTPFHESSACFLADGKTLVFVSDKPGGWGGRDIYISHFVDSTSSWGAAINAGPLINTSDNEEGVFINATDNSLYFVSDGPLSIGGYDLLKCSYQDNNWLAPVNMGMPVNSPYDDVFVSLSTDGKNLFFSSDRPGGFGRKDIYVATPFAVVADSLPGDSVVQADSNAVATGLSGGVAEVQQDKFGNEANRTPAATSRASGNKIAAKTDTKQVKYAGGYRFEVANVSPRSDKGSTAKNTLRTHQFKYRPEELKVPSRYQLSLDSIARFMKDNLSCRLFLCGQSEGTNRNTEVSIREQQRISEIVTALTVRKIVSSRIITGECDEKNPVRRNMPAGEERILLRLVKP